MLTHLFIKNFTLIDTLDLPLHAGMTVITGETGAGKSIILDALSLALGARADNTFVRQGDDRCEIIATFEIQKNAQAREWLLARDLLAEDECILRRSLTTDGRSKCFINGQPVTLQSLRELSVYLVNVHSQHEHQQLMQRDNQRELLDAFAGHMNIVNNVKHLYKQWRDVTEKLEQQKQQLGDRGSRLAFLQYQVSEFAQLRFNQDELIQLEKEHKNLTHAEQRIANYQQLLQLLEQIQFGKAQSLANTLPEKSIAELLNNAAIQLQEAQGEVESALEHAEVNPERLQQIEQRLTKIHDLARKHRVKIEELPVLQERLETELHSLQRIDVQLEQLQKDLKMLAETYEKAAHELTKGRETAAKKMAKQIEQHMQTLGMPGGKFSIQLEPAASIYNLYGAEKVEFLVSANPGQPLQLLNKVASGGELSRISLAIHLIAAQKQQLPTLIFDEVDVGIGGSTAAIVGQLLKTLAKRAQILCITHLPQVASQGNNHLQVEKTVNKKQTSTQISYLSMEDKIQEIARMLGGLKITDQTLAHAREMVDEKA
jgi:DNA repair protein RecN (Recombination protein N)